MALTPTPPSPSMDKNNKYDRQLRLWGETGQYALEGARVCLINATATGTETLKNLVLPGVGSFTIVDGDKVTEEDIGNNFFLDKESIGKSRAEVAKLLLEELNDDVHGDFMEESLEVLLENNPNFFQGFTCVIATALPEKALLKLAAILWEKEIPLIVCASYGFIGYIRLAIPEHTIVESHPDNALEDLRLDSPFPALDKFCNKFDLDSMERKEHSHTPWLIIVYKFLQIWKKEHGSAPKGYKEKNAFKDLIRSGIRKRKEGIDEDEENFDEAVKAVNTALVPSSVPDDVMKIFNDNDCLNLTTESKPLWIVARALKDFTEKEGNGLLPVRGTIPDMTSDSDRYIQLQNIYRQKAQDDYADVANRVYEILQEIAKPPDYVPENFIKLVCKNAHFLKVLRYRSLADEYSGQNVQDLVMQIEDTDNFEGVFYVLLRAVGRFHSEYNRYPGFSNRQIESDIGKLKACLNKILQEWSLSTNVRDDFVHEICRYGAAELHTVAAFIGGTAAQEVIKIITGQFTPLNNTYIYNAMKQTSTTLQL